MSSLHTVRLAQCTPQPWRNGGGTTQVLLTWPAQADWALRLSVARIDRDGPFSPFPGVARSFAVISGAGVRLRFGAGPWRRVTMADAPLDFDGSQAPACERIGGETSDLNLMVRSEAGRGRLIVARPGDPWASPAEWRALYAAAPARLRRPGAAPVDVPADSLLWSSNAAAEPWVISGRAGPDAGLAQQPHVREAPGRFWWIEFAPHPAPRD